MAVRHKVNILESSVVVQELEFAITRAFVLKSLNLQYTFFVLNSAEHEIFSANENENANKSWHFHFYLQRQYHAQLSWYFQIFCREIFMHQHV